jgi:hypothetical protein
MRYATERRWGSVLFELLGQIVALVHRHTSSSRFVMVLTRQQPRTLTGSRIAMLNDSCGNLIQITQLMRW